MGKGIGVLEGVFGWGLLTLLLALVGGFSTVLNGLQALNGLYCFDTVRSNSTIQEAAVSSFSISGYIHNHYYKLNETCSDLDAELKGEALLNVTFCQKWNTSTGPNGTLVSEGIRCGQNVDGNSNIRTYSYELVVNCTSQGAPYDGTFQLALTPGASSMTGVSGTWVGYFTTAVVIVDRCQLSKQFYVIFTSICVAVTGAVVILRALMRTCFVCLSFGLSNSVNFYWAYMLLQKYGFFSFYNPYMNEPYHLVKGEKLYVLRNPISCPGSIEMDDRVESQQGAPHRRNLSPAGSSDLIFPTELVGSTTFAWSSSNFAYKFTYDSHNNYNGGVYAYSKDHSGFETFVEANVKGSVAATILEYLKLKSEGACMTNEEKSHFLLLTECCVLAKEGYQWMEEVSGSNYRMYGRKHTEGESKHQSRNYKPM